MPTLSKQDAVNMQNKVDSKKGAGLCFEGSIATIKAKDRGKPKPIKKDALEGLKSNNWIGAEYDFQVAVARLLDASGLDWFHTPNEAKRSIGLGVKLKRAGLKSGIPDVVIITPTKLGHVGLCIELKVGKNKMTNNQYLWKDKLLNSGWAYFLAYGMDEVESILKKYYRK